jgi:hypothetical protein
MSDVANNKQKELVPNKCGPLAMAVLKIAMHLKRKR